jgi:hypothetical protein
MSVTSFQLADKDRYLGQIDKIVHSHSLRKAESLCKLLLYLADHAITQPGVSLKEYQIATEVFGRPHTFDPQTDAAIRVQAGRLRLKLSEYYSHEGSADPIIVEMPNGVYALTFHQRETPASVVQPIAIGTAASAIPPFSESQANRKPLEFPAPPKSARKWIVAVLALALAVALATIAVLSIALKSRTARQSEPIPAAALHTFWNQFASGPDVPRVIFSNAAFVGRPETGMRYMDPAHDSRDVILDHYTGVGEVLAVHELDKVFAQLNHSIEVKRGSLFTLDDAKENNLIFVGSPAENLTLLDVPGSQEFIFKRLDAGPHKGELGILNVHPESGQPVIFYPSNSAQPLTEDYAIIALVNGLNPERHMLILAGTTTIGTQAAVEYVCEKDSLEELLRNLSIRTGSDVKPFEALLRVKVARGVPVGVQLVAVRRAK